MYKIKISYRTGDSFNSFDTEDTIELTWKNLEIVKQNLQYIREHYIEHLSCDNNSIKSKKDLINKSVFRNYHINNLFITDFEYPDTIKNNQLIEFKAIYDYYKFIK